MKRVIILFIGLFCIANSLAADNIVSYWDSETTFPYKRKSFEAEEKSRIATLPLNEFMKWIEDEFILTMYSVLPQKEENQYDFPYSSIHIAEALLFRIKNEYVVTQETMEEVFGRRGKCSRYFSYILHCYQAEWLAKRDDVTPAQIEAFKKRSLQLYLNNSCNQEYSKINHIVSGIFSEKLAAGKFNGGVLLRSKFDELERRCLSLLSKYYNMSHKVVEKAVQPQIETIEEDFFRISRYYPVINNALYLECYSTNFIGYRKSFVKNSYNENSCKLIDAMKRNSLQPVQFLNGALDFTNWQQGVVFDELLDRSLLIKKDQFPYLPKDENYRHFPYQDYLRRFFRKNPKVKEAE